MTRAGIVASAVALAACSQLGGSSSENYQHLLTMMCNAPPVVMQGVLTTDQLKAAWTFICAHTGSVPPTPVTTTIAER